MRRTVILNGAAVRSCLMLAVQAEGTKVVTVEGLSHDDRLAPLQASSARITPCSAVSGRPA
jgi:aerobic-type carbon monoxide dehydrogenase small subunit (CoxS/CutS family)